MGLLTDVFTSKKENRKIGQIISISDTQVFIQDVLGRQHRVFLTTGSSFKIGDSVVAVNDIIVGLSLEEENIPVYNV